MPSSHISKIAVLQSLPRGQLQTGKQLSEDIETLNVFHSRGLDVSFYDVPTKQDFLSALSTLQGEAVRGVYPLLHIECHGSSDQTGIVLADGSFLGWKELKPFLTTINVATRCNLFIVMACCSGGHLAQLLLPTERAPCWALIGPTTTVYADEILSNMNSFYTTFLGTLDGDQSLESLTGPKLREGRFAFMPAGGFFRIAYAKYLANFCTPEELLKRGEEMHQKLVSMGSKVLPSPQELANILQNTEASSYEKYFREFFMIDLYPENAERFPIPYDDIKALQKTLTDRSRATPQSGAP